MWVKRSYRMKKITYKCSLIIDPSPLLQAISRNYDALSVRCLSGMCIFVTMIILFYSTLFMLIRFLATTWSCRYSDCSVTARWDMLWWLQAEAGLLTIVTEMWSLWTSGCGQCVAGPFWHIAWSCHVTWHLCCIIDSYDCVVSFSDFAYPTVKDRMPVILTKVVDTVFRMKSQFQLEIDNVSKEFDLLIR